MAKIAIFSHCAFGISRQEVVYKKGILRNFSKFTGKHLYQSLFCMRPATLLKKRLWHRCFPVNFAKFLRTLFLTERLRWLLLCFDILTGAKHKVVHNLLIANWGKITDITRKINIWCCIWVCISNNFKSQLTS